MRGVLPPSCRNHGNNNCTVQKVQNRTAVLKHMLIYTFNAILQLISVELMLNVYK